MDLATLGLEIKGDGSVRTVKELGTAAEKTAGQTDRLEGAWRRMNGALGPVERDILRTMKAADEMRRTQEMAGVSAEHHTLATGRISRALEGLIVESVGANRALGSLSVVMADFAIGGAVTAGVLGGLALISAAYDKITESARKAGAAQDKSIDFLLDKFRPETGRGSAVNDSYDDAVKRQALDLQQLRILQSASNDFAAASAMRSAGFQAPFHNRQDEIDRLTQDLAKANHAIALAQAHGAGVLPDVSVTSDIAKQRAEAEKAAANRDRERSELFVQESDAARHHREDITAARQLTPVSDRTIVPIVDTLTDAQKQQIEKVQALNTEYERAKNVFKSTDNAVEDFRQGVKRGVTALLESLSPGNLAQGVIGNLESKVEGAISGVIGSAITGVRHALFGANGAERDAARQAADSAKSMALQLDAVTQQIANNDLGAVLDQLKISLISTLQSINNALPGKDNEAARNAAREQATRQEAQREALARQQAAEQEQYRMEDLQVRNLRATGHGSEADLLAFKESQQREYQTAYDKANADNVIDNTEALYLSTLKQTEANELIAFQNGLLQDALRNEPTGFRVDPYTYDFQTPRPAPTPVDLGVTRPQVAGGLAASGNTTTYHIEAINIDGTKSPKEVVNALINHLDQVAAATGGSGSSRARALELVTR